MLFDFDGVLYGGDLPVHAYARHVCKYLAPAAATELILWMRRFLEESSVAARREFPATLQNKEDGYQAVGSLAAAAGVTTDNRAEAYRRSREDLARSAFAMDEPAGLTDLLAELGGRAAVWVVTNAPNVGVTEVLDSSGVLPFVDRVITDAGKPASVPGLVEELLVLTSADTADRILAVGDGWLTDVADAAHMGCRTMFVDRFATGVGNPDDRGPNLDTLIPAIGQWARQYLGGAPTTSERGATR